MSRWYESDDIHCYDDRPCFGRGNVSHNCKILTSTYPPGKCPFCKKDMKVTDGKTYEFINTAYGKYQRKLVIK